jgi:hypothetical protein
MARGHGVSCVVALGFWALCKLARNQAPERGKSQCQFMCEISREKRYDHFSDQDDNHSTKRMKAKVRRSTPTDRKQGEKNGCS